MKRSYINCYTVHASSQKASIDPGIKTNLFTDLVQSKSIVFLETPICRFAVEEKFKACDKDLIHRWEVISPKNQKFFYRYFKNTPDEANRFVYILINYDSPEDMSRELLKCSISIEPQRALIKFPIPKDNPLCFTLNNKTFLFSGIGLHLS